MQSHAKSGPRDMMDPIHYSTDTAEALQDTRQTSLGAREIRATDAARRTGAFLAHRTSGGRGSHPAGFSRNLASRLVRPSGLSR